MRGMENAAHLAGDRRKVVMLSAISSLGEYGRPYHKRAGRHIVECGFEDRLLLVIDESTLAIHEGAVSAGLSPDRIRFISEPSEIARSLTWFARPNTLIYCKTRMFLYVSDEMDRFLAVLRDLDSRQAHRQQQRPR